MITNILTVLSGDKIFGLGVFDSQSFLELIIRFAFNMLIIFIIVRYLYYASTKRKNYLFTYIVISVLIFFLTYLLSSIKLRLGFAFGLFAVFGILRYRTETIRIREMTYLFVIIAVSLINALCNKKVSYIELLFANLVIIGIIWSIEKIKSLKTELSKTITYEKIELIKPENRELLIQDIEKRTGIKINRIEIGRVNFLRDTADIKIFYYENDTLRLDEIDQGTKPYTENDDDF